MKFRTNEIISHLPNNYFDLYAISKERIFDESRFKKYYTSLKRDAELRFVRSLIHNKEYRRAKFFLQKISDKNALEYFLYYFSWYLVCFLVGKNNLTIFWNCCPIKNFVLKSTQNYQKCQSSKVLFLIVNS